MECQLILSSKTQKNPVSLGEVSNIIVLSLEETRFLTTPIDLIFGVADFMYENDFV